MSRQCEPAICLVNTGFVSSQATTGVAFVISSGIESQEQVHT